MTFPAFVVLIAFVFTFLFRVSKMLKQKLNDGAVSLLGMYNELLLFSLVFLKLFLLFCPLKPVIY